ncbi:MAG: VTT domain-containing protein [Chloroflexi bacterium]|nr:VTT domain-containing protein [Chloroflexota bacterium]
MTDFSLTDFLLTGMITYGAPALGLALLIGALGLPVPGTLFVIAAGAFARQGIIHWADSSGLGLLGAVLGDSASYAIGRFAKGWVERRFGQSAVWQKAQTTFGRRGGLAIYLTRFLLTALAVPVNLIAGGSGYPFWRFLLYDVAGEVTWIVLFGGLGYLFGSQWEAINQFISDFSGLLVGVVAFGAGVYILLRRRGRPLLRRRREQPQAE